MDVVLSCSGVRIYGIIAMVSTYLGFGREIYTCLYRDLGISLAEYGYIAF